MIQSFIDACVEVLPVGLVILGGLFFVFVRSMHAAEPESGPVRVAPENRVAPCPLHVIPARPVEGRPHRLVRISDRVDGFRPVCDPCGTSPRAWDSRWEAIAAFDRHVERAIDVKAYAAGGRS